MSSTYHIYVTQILYNRGILRFIYMLRGRVAELWIKNSLKNISQLYVHLFS